MYRPQDVSVIICAYTEQRWEDLCDAVKSLLQQVSPPKEIVVVIDHNQPLFDRACKEFPGVIVVENRYQQGASGSRNSGAEVASGSLIGFLDDDATACPDWVAQCCSGYQDDNILGVGGYVQTHWVEQRPKWFPEEFDWVVGGSYKGGPEETTAVRNLWSGNMSIRREVFEAIDGFGIGFGKTGSRSSPEDTDLCIRAIQKYPHGIWLYRPEAKIFHKVPPNRACWRYFIWRCCNEGLGKADLAVRVGAKDSIHTEQQYVLKALPSGVVRGIADIFIHGDITGLARSSAIILGLVLAMIGYTWGRLKQQPLLSRATR